MQLQTGEVVKHIESQAEAVYKAAIPTLGHGLIHLLVGAEGYLLKFTSELESDFSLPVTEGQAPVVTDPLAGVTSQDVQELLKLLRQQGGPAGSASVAQVPAPAVASAGGVDVVSASPEEPGLDKAPTLVADAAPVEDAKPVAAAPGPQSGGIPL